MSGRSSAYEQIVPMTVTGEDHGAVFLETDPVQLVIHPIPEAISKQIEITSPPRLREDTAMKPRFAVDSLERVRAEAPGAGRRPQAVSATFETRDFRRVATAMIRKAM